MAQRPTAGTAFQNVWSREFSLVVESSVPVFRCVGFGRFASESTSEPGLGNRPPARVLSVVCCHPFAISVSPGASA